MIKNKNLKRRIVEISYKLKLGHIGSNLTACDIIDEIYKIKKPDEKVIISSGHAHLAHLVVMEKYSEKDITNVYGQVAKNVHPIGKDAELLITDFGIHCDRQAGCDVSTGSLGHGIGIAVGMALADRSKNVYCLMSDGELAEGSCYEALNVIYDEGITNLKIYVNNNGYGAYRETFLMGIWYNSPVVSVVKTDMKDYPEWLQGQIAHYKVLNEEEYNELLELLS